MRRTPFVVLVLLFAGLGQPSARADEPNPMHPTFAVLDDDGGPVLASGRPASSARTCGACHDTAWIDAHNGHVNDRVRATCVDCHLKDGRLPVEPEAFDADGRLLRKALTISAPTDANCARCHGVVHAGADPLVLPSDYEDAPTAEAPWRTYDLTRTTGAVVSGQDQADSFLNLAGKDALTLPWDVHARRGVGCTACHFAPNNPARTPPRDSGLDVLAADPRRLSTAAFLKRPDHRLAAATCTACHDPTKAHDFLPYRKRHLAVLACQACHVPVLRGPALMAEDATVRDAAGRPRREWRGVALNPGAPLANELLGGYSPFLLSTGAGADDRTPPRLAPYNLVTRWAWVSLATGQPVSAEALAAAWGDDARPDSAVLAALDDDGDGALSDAERRLDTPAKVDALRARLQAVGVEQPAIRATFQTHAVQHGVTAGAWVRRDCQGCHAQGARLDAPVPLASAAPGGVLPEPDGDAGLPRGTVRSQAQGGVVLEHAADRLYVFGVGSVTWPARVGFGLFALVALGIAAHGLLRFRARHAGGAHRGPTERAYLYPAYERFWHWVMAFSVLVLLVTGFEVHGRAAGLFGIPLAVRLHDVFAAVLIANAFLSLFYHVASSAIRQFLPRRDTLPRDVMEQARYYLRGIFLGHPHPVQKSADRKLNALQQLTYLALLNVLFPLQVASGALMWAVSEWPDLAASVGGLTVVAPLHHLGAWLFLTFFLLHVYLTTTGHTVFSNLSAMVDGWEEVDVADAPASGGSHE